MFNYKDKALNTDEKTCRGHGTILAWLLNSVFKYKKKTSNLYLYISLMVIR